LSDGTKGSGDAQGVLHAAGAIGTATLMSRVLGLVREQVFAVLFGAGNLTDAFNLAFRLPNLLRNLFAEGALSAAIVPTFTQVRQNRGEAAAWRLAGRIFRVLTLLVAFLAFLGWLFAPQLVGLYASAFREIPGKFELAVRMTRILFPFFPLVALAAAFMGILNACGVFFVPALAPAVFNFVSIIVGVALAAFASRNGPNSPWQPIEGMALGVLAGAFAQAFCQLPALYRSGFRWMRAKEAWWNDRDLRRVLWLMLPGTLGLAATQVNMFVNTAFATGLGPGAVSHLSYAFRLMQFPIGVFGASLAQAALPLLSRQWLARDLAGIESTLNRGLKHSLAINLPASAGLAFLSYPVVELIFQYGRFYSDDVEATAWALAMYAAGLAAYAVVKLLVPACYALGNSRLPVVSSAISVGITLVLNASMANAYGAGGLALGTSIGALFNAAFLLVAVRNLLLRAGGKWPLRPLAFAALKHLGISLAMGLLCCLTHRSLNAHLPDLQWVSAFGAPGWVIGRVCKVSMVMILGTGFILLAGPRIGAPELAEPIDIFAKKLKNMLSRTKS
jgi:putative peptidoglycan lipid II flippase